MTLRSEVERIVGFYGSCTRSTGAGWACLEPGSGLTMDAYFTVDRVCDACQLHAALIAPFAPETPPDEPLEALVYRDPRLAIQALAGVIRHRADHDPFAPLAMGQWADILDIGVALITGNEELVGVSYCTVHAGIRNDGDSGVCDNATDDLDDMRDGRLEETKDGEPRPCDFYDTYYRERVEL